MIDSYLCLLCLCFLPISLLLSKLISLSKYNLSKFTWKSALVSKWKHWSVLTAVNLWFVHLSSFYKFAKHVGNARRIFGFILWTLNLYGALKPYFGLCESLNKKILKIIHIKSTIFLCLFLFRLILLKLWILCLWCWWEFIMNIFIWIFWRLTKNRLPRNSRSFSESLIAILSKPGLFPSTWLCKFIFPQFILLLKWFGHFGVELCTEPCFHELPFFWDSFVSVTSVLLLN